MASPEVSLAALLPFFYIYSQVGIEMNDKIQSTNPYFYWIKSYSSERFLKANAGIFNILNEIYDYGFSYEEDEVIKACLQSTRYELLFLDNFISNKNQFAVPRACTGNP